MHKEYCLPPIITGEENVLLGSGDIGELWQSFPYSKRRQENQGRTNRCVFYMWAEILENKVFNKTGRWYRVPEDEILRLWNKAKKAGLASESNGAYMNAPLKMMEDGTIITLIDEVSGDTLQIEQLGHYIVSNRSMDKGTYVTNILKEIALEGGVMCGINTKMARLGYLEAGDAPYIVEHNPNPKAIAHATGLTSFDLLNDGAYVVSAGTYGETFGDSGVVYYNLDDLYKLFTPLGFGINILTNK